MQHSIQSSSDARLREPSHCRSCIFRLTTSFIRECSLRDSNLKAHANLEAVFEFHMILRIHMGGQHGRHERTQGTHCARTMSVCAAQQHKSLCMWIVPASNNRTQRGAFPASPQRNASVSTPLVDSSGLPEQHRVCSQNGGVIL